MTPAQAEVFSIVRLADSDRYLATLYAPSERRGALFALYAFNAEIAAVRDRIHEPLPGEIRLQWWRDALDDPTAAAGHPVAAELLEAIRAYHLPVETFGNMIEARIFDLYDDPMPSRTDLEGYCGETAGALIQLCALVLDADAAIASAAAAGHAGCAQAIVGLLRMLPIHRRRGQCYIPVDILQAVGTSRDAFVLGEDRASAARAVAAMAALAREHLTAFQQAAGALPASIRPAYLPLALTGAYLDRIQSGRFDPLEESGAISPWRKHWLLLRRARSGW